MSDFHSGVRKSSNYEGHEGLGFRVSFVNLRALSG